MNLCSPNSSYSQPSPQHNARMYLVPPNCLKNPKGLAKHDLFLWTLNKPKSQRQITIQRQSCESGQANCVQAVPQSKCVLETLTMGNEYVGIKKQSQG
jgi:hypothetical protein